ncbi:general odorant-binding protein 84a [Malaya genurostris]|uniref:general odorant-binding protein 84a n=1 Tax=Malaya genurostris TaxID=325434 RepID=UPI0026F3FE91|nr:general odorant-binding protein 84a [Malaya genurostris]
MKVIIRRSFLLGILIVLEASGCSLTNNDDVNLRETLIADPATVPAESKKNYKIEDIYSECNQTFIVTMDYLNELNDTGSFPDETDKTPMCFMRCFLQKQGILTEDDKINKQLAISVGWVKNGDTIDECLPDMAGDSECERAYFLTRCVSTRALVEGRSKDSQK